MIKLKNVSKFYYSKGVIATGFTKVNLELKIGEFVAITGESGSGKSTLLNVISGLDYYDEGEMYVNESETSHFTESDFLDYRRKYIGNIFQNFNLVNSYTVYQNIELVLLLNGKKKKDVKKEIINLIKKVDLYKFRNTKVSKLSGGQKQRVAIARALAKDTPIIIADEPTGNLDSKSAKSIIKLLYEISKDKLVIIVTHNFEQVSPYVTRVIKMYDGKILEDKNLKEHIEEPVINEANYKNITLFNKIRLGFRNTFNIVPKFLLILCVFLFITLALLLEYSSFKKEEYINSKSGNNYYFNNTRDDRIVINKKDKSSITEEDYKKIIQIDNVKNIVKNDLLLDTMINVTDENYLWLNGRINSIDMLEGKLDIGKLPQNESEIVISGNKNSYYLDNVDEILNKEFYVQDNYIGKVDKNIKFKIVGIKYVDDYYDMNFYVGKDILDKLSFNINKEYSEIKVLFQDIYYNSNMYDQNFMIEPNSNVEDGNVYISGDLSYLCKYNNCINNKLSVSVSNIYYNDIYEFNISKMYYKYNIDRLLALKDYTLNNGKIFMSNNDYYKMFNKGNYQSSVFVKDVNLINDTASKLDSMGYTTLKIKDTLVKNDIVGIIRIFKTIVTVVLVITLFFITYFVTKLILKSRNVYFSTIRMLGASLKVSKELLIIELLTVINIAYFGILFLEYLNYKKVINIGFINVIIEYLKFSDYILLYFILIVMSYLISLKFAKKIFKDSAISTLNEEV